MKTLQGKSRVYTLNLTGRTFITYLEHAGRDLIEDLKGIETVGMATLLNLLFSLSYSADRSLDYDKFIDNEDTLQDIMNLEFVEKLVNIITDLFGKYQGKKETKKN